MATLLVLIYIAFISLGLPDALLGAAWPKVSESLGVALSMAGWASMIVSGGTIVSSLLSNRLIHRFGTGLVMIASVGATAVTLLLCSFVGSFPVLCALMVPLGLGAGSVDAALNNFVAQHYKASHMNWLHCCWGVGATVGPAVMAFFLARPGGWHAGYRTISLVQLALTAALMLSLPLWKRAEQGDADRAPQGRPLVTNGQALCAPGVALALVTFLCFVGFEAIAGLWMASFLVQQRGLGAVDAAGWASLFFLGTTVGRVLSGLLALRLSGRALIRIGCSLAVLAAALLCLPLPTTPTLVCFFALGLGNAPLYPAMIHETPRRFGTALSQAAMGLQMAAAYMGSTFLPPLTGLLSKRLSLSIVPFMILLFALLGFCLSELLNRATNSPQPAD